MTHFSVRLRDYDTLYLCHGDSPIRDHEFNDPTVSKVVKFTSMDKATRYVTLMYPGVPHELFTFLTYDDTKWELAYILPKAVDGTVVDPVKYVLQVDGSLSPYTTSMNSRTFDSYEDAYIHMKQLGILMSCFVIPQVTEDF